MLVKCYLGLGEALLRRPTRLNWFLIVFCIVLAVFFGLACAFGGDGDIGVTVRLADEPSCSPDETYRALSLGVARTPLAGIAVQIRAGALGPFDTAHGGLCLLI